MNDEITITDNAAEHRYDISVDGQPAGFSAYLDTETAGTRQRILYHTVIGDEFGGQGLASTLTREAISRTVEDGYRIVPVCPYVKKWVGKHEDFADHIDAVAAEHLALFS